MNETVAEYLKRGGKITQCAEGTARGIAPMRFTGTRHNSARTRAYRLMKPSVITALGFAGTNWDNLGK